MKILLTCFLLILSLAALISCQREISPEIEPPSAGVLQKDSNNNCEPFGIAGNYVAGQNLNDSNYLEVSANITSPGSYTISTDTINGYFFMTTGKFMASGPSTVKLAGKGTPVIPGTDLFTINYNGSLCIAPVPVDNVIKTAVFTFEGAAGACMNDTVYGSYIKNISLNADAKVKLSLHVITPGTYSITTNTMNGYSFAGSGSLTDTGLQTIFLAASGTPLNTGTDIFTVLTPGSSCSFAVTVLTEVTVTSDDYFPLTANSYWTYDDLLHGGDSIKKTVVDTITIKTNLYKIIREDLVFGGPYQYFFRKAGSDYLEYAAPNKFTTFFQYKNPVDADIPFLKENLTTGATWETPEYKDTSTNGDIITLKYDFTCTNADAHVTINGNAFVHVYTITMMPLLRLNGGTFEYTQEAYLFYYAKGIGLIYMRKTLSTFLQTEIQIRNWHVN